MKIDPVAAVRNSAIAVAFAVAAPASYAGLAVPGSSTYCWTHPADRITNCFLDLTRARDRALFGILNRGAFVGTSAELAAPPSAQSAISASLQQSGSIQHGTVGGKLQSTMNDDLGIRIREGSIKLGDITKVKVCDTGDRRELRHRRDLDNRNCARYYEFLLDASERTDAKGKAAPDELKGIAGPGGDIRPALKSGVDAGPKADVPVVVTSDNKPDAGTGSDSDTRPVTPDDTNGTPKGDVPVVATDNKTDDSDVRALIPASSFTGLPDDTFVYVHSTFGGTGNRCQEGSRESSCPASGTTDAASTEGAAVPLPSTAMLLGIGLAGMIGMRRRRSPDFVSR